MIAGNGSEVGIPPMDDLLANHEYSADSRFNFTPWTDLAADLMLFEDSPQSEDSIRNTWEDVPVRYGGRMFPRTALLDYYKLKAEGEIDIDRELQSRQPKCLSYIPPYEEVKEQLRNNE
jgi:hypothetical protein